MTTRDRILAYLEKHTEGLDDDELALALVLKSRQHANQVCRQLEKVGLVARRIVGGKIHNFLVVAGETSKMVEREHEKRDSEDQPWFWEGNVQDRDVEHLKKRDYTIESMANTLTKERGKDIVAKGETGVLWVTVKGYPKGTSRTNPMLQAGHWFKDAFFDMALWRGECKDASLAIALPDFGRYRKLADRVQYAQDLLGFTFIWVNENGEVVFDDTFSADSSH